MRWVGEHFNTAANIKKGQRETFLHCTREDLQFASSKSQAGAASPRGCPKATASRAGGERRAGQERKHPHRDDEARESPEGNQAVIREVYTKVKKSFLQSWEPAPAGCWTKRQRSFPPSSKTASSLSSPGHVPRRICWMMDGGTSHRTNKRNK